MQTLFNGTVYFSYGQFMAYDGAEPFTPDWTQKHSDQGFVRSESHVSFRTLAQFGTADLQVFSGSLPPTNFYDVAIAVPFAVVTGTVAIEGPEEVGFGNRKMHLPIGSYRLIAAQKVIRPAADQYSEDELLIDCYFESIAVPLSKSSILVANSLFSPGAELLEAVDI